MPILPLDHPEPFAATLGIMLYPGDEEAERRKAKAFAAQYLARMIRGHREAAGLLDQQTLMRFFTDAGEQLDNLEKRWWGGLATGELFKVFFTLANTEPALASWNNAAKVIEAVTSRNDVKGMRSSLWAERTRFLPVAHLWAAWSIREGRFFQNSEVGYDGYADLQSFLTEAEILRQWGQSWRPGRAKSNPPLPDNVWHVPDDWQPPEPQPGWPDTGKIPHLSLPRDLLADLKPAGRPKKSI